MEAIENAAIISVGRATGFAALAIVCIVMSLSYEPVIAARAGCILCLIVAAILFHYSLKAPSRPYRQTELWIILAKEDRPPKSIAQQLIGSVLHRTYRKFAEYSVLSALIFMILAVILGFFPDLRIG
ncbi:hypothetical protein NUH88_19260 [Nisaea acidiphila]|uniref:Uncharacterized protein n=1 Tax=Nisaea acidiphila TaxID=1862145 RepID=A0A9J7AVS6_9PROT|nr:hypothetical protein [Nisaea acidiphila]UUX49525.1 hypothetical protein NUH88_19260 [Nisaea acidiphila]